MITHEQLQKIKQYPWREAEKDFNAFDRANIKEIADNFMGRVTIQGEDAWGLLVPVYCMAKQNACDRAVLSFLGSIDNKEASLDLAEGIFFRLSKEQRCKTVFSKRINEVFRKKKQGESREEEYQSLSEEVLENILREMDLEVRLNTVTKKTEVTGSGAKFLFEKYSRENITSTLPTILYDVCRSRNIRGTTLQNVRSYLINMADANRYNPIRDMLAQYKNDDRSHLENIYNILGLQTQFHKVLVRKWLIQTVAFAFADYDNPVSTEGVLVLQGEQGICKTSFFRVLAGEPLWFTEAAVLDMRNKDTLLTAISGWICELGEIDSTFKKDQSALKGFITRTVDKIRLPYAYADSDMPRTTSLCGTVNPEEFLKDVTGNRRYWTIHIDKIDRTALFSMTKEDVFRLWGYIYHLWLQDKQGFRLSEKESAHLNASNYEFTAKLQFEDEIREFLDFTLPVENWDWFSPSQIAGYFRRISAEQVGRIFARIEREERDVQTKRIGTTKNYLLPLSLTKIEYRTNDFNIG